MVQVAELDGFLSYALPLRREVAVFQIDGGLSNQLITKHIIIVHQFDDKWRTSWEGSIEFISFIEVRVHAVHLVVFSLIIDCAATTYQQIGVRCARKVSLGEVKSIENMQSDNAPVLGEEKFFENLFGIQVCNALDDIKVTYSEILQHGLDFVSALIGNYLLNQFLLLVLLVFLYQKILA
jgi:hypothetical protein